MEVLMSYVARDHLSSDYGCLRFAVGPNNDSVTGGRIGNANDEQSSRILDRVISGWVIDHKSALSSPDLSADPRFPAMKENEYAHSTALAIPIGDNGQITGVLIVSRSVTRPYGSDDRLLLELIAQVSAPMIARLRRERAIHLEYERLKSSLAQEDALASLIGRSAAWDSIRSRIRTIAPTETRVLLLGESGTGKELCAKALHRLSSRREGRFVAVNCAAIPDQIAESEFFGHVKGAFTGASRGNDGLFVAADGGTLFLDEIGSTPLPLQSMLLRTIQDGDVRPVGSGITRKVDVRLVCSTSAELGEMVAAGTFRKDLYYRINVVTLTLPALRDRKEDIGPLAQSFLIEQGRVHGRTTKRISPEAMSVLELYHWPGNVRELQNAIEHAVLFTPTGNDFVEIGALPESIRLAVGLPSPSLPILADAGLDGFVDALEARIIQNTLGQCGWNQSAAARILQVPEKRIRDKVKKYKLGRGSDHEPA